MNEEKSQPPFANCKFQQCDLPGQCTAEGKCHHPKDSQPRKLTTEQRRELIDLVGWWRYPPHDRETLIALVESWLPPQSTPADARLFNLLARIHRDGGHYVAEHGLAKAVADADTKISELYAAAPADALTLEWLWENCRIIYFPKGGKYPIEHQPFAVGGKDGRLMIEAEYAALKAQI